MNNPRITGVECTGGRVNTIAFFGNRQGNNCHLWLAKFLNNLPLRNPVFIKAFVNGTDNLSPDCRPHLFPARYINGSVRGAGSSVITAEQADFTDPPVAADVIQHAIGEQRLVRAVKRAKAEMDNTRAELAAIVLRVLHVLR